MAHLARLTPLLLLALVLVGLVPPAPAQAQSTPACQVAAQAALTQQGAIYSQGGHLAGDPIMPNGDYYPRTGPDSFDCSGLVWWAYQQAGVDVGWTTVQQANSGERTGCGLDDLNGTSTSCWAPGDIVLLQYQGGQHVALYTGAGLFLDCYNHATGCILHAIQGDSFYQAHFWQARRPVSGCEGQSIDPGLPSPGAPSGAIPWEYTRFSHVPDLVGYVSFRTPTCCADGSCVTDSFLTRLTQEQRKRRSEDLWPGQREHWITDIRIPLPWGGVSFPALTPINGTLMLVSWLFFQIEQLLLDLVCWLLQMLQIGASVFAWAINIILHALNYMARFFMFAWLTAQRWLLAFWGFVELVVQLAVYVQEFVAWALAWLAALGELLLVVLNWLGELALILVDIALALFGMLAWLVGLTVGMLLGILTELGNDGVPAVLAEHNVIYYIVRGVLDGILESQIGWVVLLFIGFAYVRFFFWVAKYFRPG